MQKQAICNQSKANGILSCPLGSSLFRGAVCLTLIGFYGAQLKLELSRAVSHRCHTHTHSLQTWTALDFYVPPLTLCSRTETMEGLQTEGLYLKTQASGQRNAGGSHLFTQGRPAISAICQDCTKQN